MKQQKTKIKKNLRKYSSTLSIYTKYISLLVSYTSHRLFTKRDLDVLQSTYIHKFMLEILKSFQVKSKQLNNFPHIEHERPCILMSNHASMFDIPIIYNHMTTKLRMIARDDVFSFPLPFFNKALLHMGFIKVNPLCRKSIKSSYLTAKKKLQQGYTIWASPEGGISRTGELMPFKNGVFKIAEENQAIIIPMAISGSGDILNSPDGWLKLDPQFNKQVYVKFAKPIDTKDYQGKRSQINREVKQSIQTMLESIKNT